MLDHLSTWPGIETLAVGAAPIGPDQATRIAQPRVLETETARFERRVGLTAVGPEYFEALGLRILEGRALTNADISPAGPRSALITASLATALWPGQSAIGRRVRMGYSGPDTGHIVVGVVNDFAFGSIRFEPRAVLLSAASAEMFPNTLPVVIRTRHAATDAARLERALAELMPNAPRLSVVTGRDLIAADLGRERLAAWFFSGFGLVALVLGVGGVFGLVAYLAESRRRELGVRIALGATPARVVTFALMAALVPAALGAMAGLLTAAWFAESAKWWLVGVSRVDPLTFAAALLLVITVAAGAALAAAWRVRCLSPIEALRSE